MQIGAQTIAIFLSCSVLELPETRRLDEMDF